jgi:hypothetical protein
MLGAVGRMRAGKTLRTPLAVIQLRFLMVAVLIARSANDAFANVC